MNAEHVSHLLQPVKQVQRPGVPRLMLALLGVCVVVGLAACAGSPLDAANRNADRSTPTYFVIDTPFDRAEHERAMRPGRSSIVGTVAARLKVPGELLLVNEFKPGTKVFLQPMTTYWTAFLKAYRRPFPHQDLTLGPVPGRPIPKRDPAMGTFMRETVTDKFGRYAFNGLAPGKYRVGAEFDHNFYTLQRFNVGSSQTNYGPVTHTQDREVRVRIFEELEEIVEIGSDGQQVEASFSRSGPRNYAKLN